jgi:activator of HSP90 ATPase
LDGPSYVGDQPYELKKQRLSPLFLLAKGKSRTMHELQPKKKMKKKGMQVYSLREREREKKISVLWREARANSERRRRKI